MFVTGITDLPGASAVVEGSDELGTLSLTTGTSIGTSPSFIFQSTELGGGSGVDFFIGLTPLDSTTETLNQQPNNTVTIANGAPVIQVTIAFPASAMSPNTTYNWAYRTRKTP